MKSFLSGDQQVVQFPGFTSAGYTYNGENSIIINNYSTPLTIMPYPFSVGDSHSDAVYDIEFTCPICPPYMFRDHEITTEALGSGTVTMPDGTVFENVVLVEHVAVFSDAQTGSSPCITTRTSTERQITVKSKVNIMTGYDQKKIIAAVRRFYDIKIKKLNLFGDGRVAEKIYKFLKK